MKTYKNLWDKFISEENIKSAIHNSSMGSKKKKRKDVKRVLKDIDYSVNYFIKQSYNYKNDNHIPQVIYDGISRKKRTIIVPTYRELVIQHMLINVLKPMMLQGAYERAYGSIPGRGSHNGKKVIEKWIKYNVANCKYVLKLDIKKYFESIPHDVLKAKLQRQIKDEKILDILFEIIDTTDKGLPLGFYTSQWLAMWYLKDFDHFVKEKCYAPHYIRYMDDMVIMGSNKKKLIQTLQAIIEYLDTQGLELNNRSQIFRFVYYKDNKKYGRDLDFMGFRFFRNKTILRKSIYMKMCRKARRVYKKDKPSIYELRQMLSYLGWVNHTNVYGAYELYIKPFFDFGKAKKRIGKYDRRNNKCGINQKIATQ